MTGQNCMATLEGLLATCYNLLLRRPMHLYIVQCSELNWLFFSWIEMRKKTVESKAIKSTRNVDCLMKCVLFCYPVYCREHWHTPAIINHFEDSINRWFFLLHRLSITNINHLGIHPTTYDMEESTGIGNQSWNDGRCDVESIDKGSNALKYLRGRI